jgi:hypothetical protein
MAAGGQYPSPFLVLLFLFYFLNIYREKMASDEDEWEKYYSDLVEGVYRNILHQLNSFVS